MYFYHHVLSFYTHLSSTYTIRYFIFFTYIYIHTNYNHIIINNFNRDYFVCILPSLGAYQYPPSYFFAQQIKQQTSYSTTRPTLSIKKILFGLKDTYVDIYSVSKESERYIYKKTIDQRREREEERFIFRKRKQVKEDGTINYDTTCAIVAKCIYGICYGKNWAW